MYTGLLHSHRLVVILFVVLYVIKLVLLLAGRQEQLAKFAKKTRIPEIIISSLFLLTGVGMLFMVAEVTPMILTKIVVVLGSIPIAVVGFRKSNKLLASLSVILLITAYGLAEMNKVGVNQEAISGAITQVDASDYDIEAHGAAIYKRNCSVCHGENGAAQRSGAKNIRVTQLTDEEIMSLLVNGKNTMPAYKGILAEQDMKAVIAYLHILKD